MAEDLLDQLLAHTVEDQGSNFEEENERLSPILDEVNLIRDQGIRFFVRAVLLRAKDFWDSPGGRNHHPPDERSAGGNITHTKRVVRISNMLIDSFSGIEVERDVLIAAAILHDVTKYRDWSDDGSFTYDRMHPYTVDLLVKELQAEEENLSPLANRSTVRECDPEIVDTILHIIRTHLGPWSPVPETQPITMADWALHLADNIASRLHLIVDDEVQEWRWIRDTSSP